MTPPTSSPTAVDAAWLAPIADGVVTGVCPHDCPDCCSIVSEVTDGRLTRVAGNSRHPVTRGFICRKFARAPERVYAADRIFHPLRRRGPKGSGAFERVSWDAAVAEIAARWRRIIDESGPRAVLPFFGSGTEGLINGRIAGRRFFNRMGTAQLERTICTKAGRTGFDYTLGSSMGAEPLAAGDCDLFLLWGCNIACTNIHQQALVQAARRRGATIVVINPVRVKGSAHADHVLQPVPGTDAALALAMMHVILAEGLEDGAFVARHTTGLDRLRERIAGYPPARAAALCGVPAAEIVRIARRYAATARSFIYIGPGCQRHTNGGMTVRAIACLPALTGAWAHRGSGAYYPTSTIFPVATEALEGGDLRPTPPAPYNMLTLGELLADQAAGIRSLYVFNGNPASTLYNQNRLREGLSRDDLFTIVHERVLTDTARYADIVLPATTQFEQLDLQFSYYHYGVMLNRPAIQPLGEARSNLDTFSVLAAAMGYADACFGQSAWDIVSEILRLDHPALAGVTTERLRRDGWCPATIEGAHACVRDGGFPTATGRIELYSARMAADGFDPLPAYEPPRESRDSTPALYAKYPLQFITPALCGTHKSSHARDRADGPALRVHPSDAVARGIADGDLVEVFNDRGACVLSALIDGDVRQGVVVGQGLWWDECYATGHNANRTTPDFPGDMGGGSSFNTNLVELRRADAATRSHAAV